MSAQREKEKERERERERKRERKREVKKEGEVGGEERRNAVCHRGFLSVPKIYPRPSGER